MSDELIPRNSLGDGLVEHHRDYFEQVMAVGRDRYKNFGRQFNYGDFLMGAAVVFQAGGVWDHLPALFVFAPMSGRNPFLPPEEQSREPDWLEEFCERLMGGWGVTQSDLNRAKDVAWPKTIAGDYLLFYVWEYENLHLQPGTLYCINLNTGDMSWAHYNGEMWPSFPDDDDEEE